MRRQIGFALLALAGLASAPAPVLAQDTQPRTDDLYQNALQSIAEGRRNDASNQLARQIEKEPLHAGAWLDLAMTQCALGHADEAERLFATIETRFDPSPAMLRLIAETREEGCNRWHPTSTSALSLGRGIDQNVNQGPSNTRFEINAPDHVFENELTDEFKPHHDQYTALSADYSRDVTRNGTVGFAQFVARRNDHLHQYDSNALFAGIEKPWRFGRWTVRGSGTLGAVTLGSQLYQRQAQLQARVGPPLPLPNTVQFNLVAGASYTDFLTLTNFNSHTFELRALLTWRPPDAFASLSLGALEDRALAHRPGGDRAGLFANALLRRRLGPGLSGEVAYTRQYWNSREAYSPGLIDEARTQHTRVLRANLVYALAPNQTLQLEARVVQNRENISIFQYNNRLLQLSWQWQGQ
jgi:cytochrome c-type biogenesis protein CcmH/NrfG